MQPGDVPGEETLVPTRRASVSTLAAGDLVADRYRVVRFIARGAMGEVYEVEDAVLGERVALKLLRPELASSTALVEQFRREVQLARRVTHPNVCRLHDVGASGDHLFLTMQLLDGVPLHERLPMGEADALRYARDMADALVAAHEAGVVHRDFKPGNVMVVGDRAIVTDFGLSGTPAYMAPEQVVGKPVGHAADLYALGVVLFEMRTGKRPFATDDRARLTNVPPLDIDEPWRRVIARLLSPDPDARYPTARAAIDALEPTPRRRAAWTLIASIVVLSAIGLGLVLNRDEPTTLALPTVSDGTTIAVVGFEERVAGDRAWIGAALAEIMPLEIDGKRLRAVPSRQVATARLELRKTKLDNADLAALAKKLDARFVVTGDFHVGTGKIDFDLRVFDRATGSVHGDMHVTGSEADLVGVAHAASARLAAKLLGEALPPPAPGIRASLPANVRAARLYAEGLVASRRFDLIAARERLQAAITIEPSFPLAYHALSEVLAELGEEVAWKKAAEQAWERADSLPTEEKLLVEVRYRSARGEHDRAREIYRALYQLRPEEIGHQLHVAELSPSEERLAIYAQLRKVSNHPRIDLHEADFLKWSDVPEAIAAFERAEAAARQRGERLLLARIIVDAHPSHILAGSEQQARAKLFEARSIYEDIGDLGGLAWTFNVEGDTDLQHGRLHAAIALYQRSIDLARAARSEGDVAAGLMSIGLAKARSGDPTAVSDLDSALEIVRRVKPRRIRLVALFRAGVVMLRGDFDHAEPIFRDFGADLLGYQLGQIARWRGDQKAARAAFEAGIATNTQSGDRLERSRVHTELARLARETSKLPECEKHAHDAIDDAKAVHAANLEGSARAQLAACLLLQKKPDAHVELERATKLGETDEELQHLVMKAIVDAQFTSSRAPLQRVLARAQTAGYAPLVRELERESAKYKQ